MQLFSGELNPGEVSGIPIIRDVLRKNGAEHRVEIIDGPPGTACPAIECISHADYCVLVAEPTVFGLHDLALLVSIVRQMEKPHGVIINKSTSGNMKGQEYCLNNGIDILAEIGYSKDIALLNSNAIPAVLQHPQLRENLLAAFSMIEGRLS